MKFKYINIVLAVLIAAMAMLMAACNIFGNNEPDEPDTPEIPVETGPREGHRTVLVYMLAANSLGAPGSWGEYDRRDLEEMQQAAANGAIGDGHLVVYHVPYKGEPVLVEIKPEGPDTLKTYAPDVLSVRSERMAQVFDDMRSLAPSRQYGLILWSHASGWLQNGIDESDNSGIQTLSFGDQSGKRMNVTTLAKALDGQGFDFLYFDCCNMANVEVAYELRNAASMMAASATELPGPGMPYHKTLPYFFAEGDPDVIGAANATYDVYHEGIDHPEYSYFTISVFDLTAMNRLAAAVSAVYDKAGYGLPSRRPQRFSANQYYYDLEDYLSALTDDIAEAVPEAAANLEGARSAIAEAVLYQAALPKFNSIPINKHCGFTTYILQDSGAPDTMGYRSLSWFNDVAIRLLAKPLLP